LNIKALYLSLFLFAILLGQCKKVEPGITTTVRGYVIDSVKNKRLANAGIIIYGCNITYTPGARACRDSVAGGRTNAKGDFNFSFVSDGNYMSYAIEGERDVNYWFNKEKRLTVGITNDLVLGATENSYLKMHLVVLNNPFNSMIVFGGSSGRHRIQGISKDTIIYFRASSWANISYTVVDAAGKTRSLREDVRLENTDTTSYQKIIQNTQDFK
jgi:hypothetical protein